AISNFKFSIFREAITLLKALNKISSPLYFLIKPKNKITLSSSEIPNFFLAACLLMMGPKLSYKGCGTNFTGLFFTNCFRSAKTFSLIVIKPSTGFTKYLVNILSPGLFSCGNTLSAIQTICVWRFFFMILKIVPRQGPIKGSQYLTTIISGFIFFNSFPTLIQFKGFTELIFILIGILSGAASDEYCVFPGKR